METEPLILLPKKTTILSRIPLPEIEIEREKMDVNVSEAIKLCLLKINPEMLSVHRSSKGSKIYQGAQLKSFIHCILQIDNLSKYLDKNSTLIADLRNSMKKKKSMVEILHNLYEKYVKK